MSTPENFWSTSQNFEAVYKTIADYYHKYQLDFKPLYTQDGSEIHSKLQGVTFKFWGIPGETESLIAVNFEGPEDEKNLQLTGGLYKDFSEAKAALRTKAAEIYSETTEDRISYKEVA